MSLFTKAVNRSGSDRIRKCIKKVLPIKKVAALFAAEEGFRQHLFRQFKDGGPGKPGPGKPGPRRDEPMKRPAKDKTQK